MGSITLTATEGADYGIAYTDSRTDDQITMPGDTVNYSLNVKQGADQSFYYAVIINVKVKQVGADNAESLVTIAPKKASELKVSKTAGEEVGGTLVLEGKTFGNEYEGATITLDWEVRAIQKANVTADEAFYALVFNYDLTNFGSGNIDTKATA